MDRYCEGIGSVGCKMVFFTMRTGKQRCSRDITPQLTRNRQLTHCAFRTIHLDVESASRTSAGSVNEVSLGSSRELATVAASTRAIQLATINPCKPR
jgi:hypothetical protein